MAAGERAALRKVAPWLVVLAGLSAGLGGCGEGSDDGAATTGASDAFDASPADVGADAAGDGATEGADAGEPALGPDSEGATGLGEGPIAAQDANEDGAPEPTAEALGMVIEAVTPAEGPTSGMTEVLITGKGLGQVVTAYFGESAAVETETLDDWTVRAVAPPRTAGFVDVTLQALTAKGDAVEVTLQAAYRYKATMALTAVTPGQGDVAGGALVTVEGFGFSDDTQFVFGDRLAVTALVHDEHAATLHTPPGVAGRVDVHAVGSDGAATLSKAFFYTEAPRIDGVAPAVVPLSGLKVRAQGAGLLGDGAVVSLVAGAASTLVQVVASAADGSWIDVQLPAQAGGATFDLRYSRPGASVTKAKAVTYASFVNPTTGKSQKNEIVAVTPAVVAANESADVDLHLVGPIAAAQGPAIEVRVGNAVVPLIDSDVGTWSGPQPGATLRVRVPALNKPWTPLAQGILVKAGNQEAFLAGGLKRSAALPRLIAVTPGALDAAGGTLLTLHVDPGSVGPADSAPIGVRVGALFASGLSGGAPIQGKDGAQILMFTAHAPPGSPGPALVTATFPTGTSSLAGAVFYGGAPALAAVLPASGSRAGNTLVKVVGAGLDRLDRLFFGNSEAKDLQHIHPGLVLARTPAGEVGTVGVEGWFLLAAGAATLPGSTAPAVSWTLASGFTYYDPQAGHAGSWGGPIAGALDITVRRANLDKGPIEGVLVVVEQPGKPTRTALTDSRGQATLSELDLHGPLQVSVARQGYTAASMVAVDSRHLTFRLTQFVTPPPDVGAGQGEGEPEAPDPFPDGAIEGVVLNGSKYANVPLGGCAGALTVGGNCLPCDSDFACPGDLTCEWLRDPLAGFSMQDVELSDAATATLPRVCSAPCGGGAPACPKGFGCRVAGFGTEGGPRLRCMPLAGEAQTRCRTSMPGLFGGNPDPGAKSNAAPDGTFRIESRLGDIAVACTVGYLPKGKLSSGSSNNSASNDGFVPLAMGITRSVTVGPGQTTAGVKVVIDTPMTRTIDLHLQGLPMGDDVKGDERFVTAVLDLGAAGYLPAGNVLTRLHTDRLRLTRQPSGFSGDNADIRYTFYAGLSQPGGDSPLTIAIAEELEPQVSDFVAFWPTGAAAPEQGSALGSPIRAVATDGKQVIAVGDRGGIYVWGGTSLTQQGSPTTRDLGAVWLDPLGSGVGFAGGAQGTWLRRDPVAGWQAAIGPLTLGVPTVPEGVDTIVDIAGLHEHDLWIADGGNRIWHRTAQGFEISSSPMAQPTLPTSIWPPAPPSPRLRALQRLGDGTLIAMGDDAMLALAQPSGGLLSWQLVAVSKPGALHGAFGVSKEDFWVGGDHGMLLHVVAGKATALSSGTFQPLFAVAPTETGLLAAGGAGTLVRVGFDGVVQAFKTPDVKSDLRAVVAVEGGVLAMGTPALPLGPFLELPVFDKPAWGAPLGKVVDWHSAGGVTPTLNMLRIAGPDYKTHWEVFSRGDVEEVVLPDFQSLGGFSPVPPGQLRLRLWRIYAPGLTIDSFQSKQLSAWQWVSYAYAVHLTSLPVQVQAPAAAGPAPSFAPKPSLPKSPYPSAP